ncbi:hypothetical protein BUALT_Bualt05G0040300 [Buddleja alternifolia]|uniref:Apyrase n=1 Tax=Buddleja alternifolia TaxID=168488 RepID=A0AAV6XSA8_9LAMI|nr:hypothetical protein BUALT_Bualt05G0040300 [Buddleja alternifolia]
MQRSGGSNKMQGKQCGISRSRLLLGLFVIININMMMINISAATSAFFQLHDAQTLTRRSKFFIATLININDVAAAGEEALVFTPITTSSTPHDANDDGDDDDSSSGNNKYALIFDAGSTGSRVHVFKFDSHLNLLPIINHDFEFINKVSINYLLGNLGKPYSETVGVVDLGGGSVQMNYAISEETAANAPTPTPNPSGGGGDQDSYLAQWNLNGTTYYLYAHSYLRYGLEASRAEILKLSGDAGNPCVINGYQGTYILRCLQQIYI